MARLLLVLLLLARSAQSWSPAPGGAAPQRCAAPLTRPRAAAGLADFAARFSGAFDNAAQVASGSGHEPVHCALVPCASGAGDAVAAADGAAACVAARYTFDGDPRATFRLRLYTLAAAAAPAGDGAVTMGIWRPSLAGALALRDAKYDAAALAAALADGGAWRRLPAGCDVTWRPDGPSSYTGAMAEDGTEITSQYDEGARIRIIDSLVLAEGALYVDDRGYDATDGTLLYGRPEGEPPYALVGGGTGGAALAELVRACG